MVDNLVEKVDKCPLNRGHLVCVQFGPQKLSLYRVERWPQNRGFLSTILNGDAGGTKVSVHHRQGGRASGVVVKRGSTVVKKLWFSCRKSINQHFW